MRWLVGHTLIEDRLIVSGDPVKQWENLLSEDEQTVMGQTIASLLYNIFQSEPRLISDCYGGEIRKPVSGNAPLRKRFYGYSGNLPDQPGGQRKHPKR